MTARKARLATLAVAALATAALAATATVASAFPNRTNYCTNCHSTAGNVIPTATLVSNDGVNATYNVSVPNPWNDGTTGWAVFDSTVNIRNGYGAGSFSVPVGKTYRVYGVAGIGGNGANYVTISPAAPAPADITAPVVALTSPSNGATVAGSVALAATATDAGSGVARVEFRVDGVLVGTDTTAPYAAAWDATLAAPGSHAIEAKAVDNAGNAAASTVSVNIASPPPPADTTAPAVAITSPANGATVAGSVALAATATDAGSGVANVQFRVDGVLVGSDTTAPFAATWDASLAASGSYLIQVTATDVAGNSATTSISVTIAPPLPPAAVNLSDLTVTVVDSNAAALSGAKVVIVNSLTGARTAALTTANGTVVFTDVDYGTYRVQATYKGKRRTVTTLVADAPTESMTITLAPRR